jgi:hypothetical protein
MRQLKITARLPTAIRRRWKSIYRKFLRSPVTPEETILFSVLRSDQKHGQTGSQPRFIFLLPNNTSTRVFPDDWLMKTIWDWLRQPSVLMKPRDSNSFHMPYGGSSVYPAGFGRTGSPGSPSQNKSALIIKQTRPIWLSNRNTNVSRVRKNWPNCWKWVNGNKQYFSEQYPS